MELGIKIILSVFSFVFGSVLASFAGVVAFRTPKKQSIIKPDSYCPNCGRTLKWYDNIPIVSYLVLGGKCRFCNNRIGFFGFLCELFCGVLFLLAFLRYELSLHTAFLFVLFTLFVVIAQIDFDENEIYDVSLIIFAVLAIGMSLWQIFYEKSEPWWNYCVACAIGFAFFGLIKLIAWLIMKQDALGSGDVFLCGIAGAMLGIFPLFLGIMIATLVGSVVELIRIKIGSTDREAHIAFAPYLLLGFSFAAIYGNTILKSLEVLF